MGKTLVVVESPAKAKTIKKYLGNGFEVLASKGHLKDLPKRMGIDVEAGFRETYEIIEAKAKVLSELKAKAKTVDRLLLATDPDREGEAIAFHLAEELGREGLDVSRVEFEEITKKGVAKGLEHPRGLDGKLYDAQRARRVLDRIVGYDVSALVWNKLAFGLSAGRVQSVALRLIVEREREIEAFVPEEYWNVAVPLKTERGAAFQARFVSRDGEKIEVKNREQAESLYADLDSAQYRVAQITRREQKRNAPAPYTTSKLQQDASSYLRFPTKRTMSVAQKLYEGVDLKKDGGPVGLITYMRTDSVRVSADAIEEVRQHVLTEFGAKFVPAKPNAFKSRKDAQEAHEAIRPTSLEFTPELVKKHLTDEQYKLYKLIWDRFVASQMSYAVYDQTGVDIEAVPTRPSAGCKKVGLRASGKVLKFAGWLEQYARGKSDKPFGEDAPRELAGEEESAETEGTAPAAPKIREDDGEGTLPELAKDQSLALDKPPGVLTEQKFTQPPARFNEGSLVRELEKRGIGRPSTYAEIISKVQARDYVEKLPGGQMKATDLGKVVVDGLVSTSLEFMNPSFTALMEEELDEVAEGKLARVKLLERFYGKFRETLELAKKQKRWTPEPKLIGEACPECGKGLYERWSKNGWFIGCEGYPKCKFTRSVGSDGQPEEVRLTEHKCEQCGKPMAIRTGRFGEFLSCTGYPECKTTRPMPLGVACPKCGRDVVEVRAKKRGGKAFYGCVGYPSCDFKLWQKPVPEPCPNCGLPFLLRAGGEKNPKLVCSSKECGYSRPLEIESGDAGDGVKPAAPPMSQADAAADA
jgi:DNA topoisomerase I